MFDSQDPQMKLMRTFFGPKTPSSDAESTPLSFNSTSESIEISPFQLSGYLSDEESASDSEREGEGVENDKEEREASERNQEGRDERQRKVAGSQIGSSSHASMSSTRRSTPINYAPALFPLKRRKHDIPVRKAIQQKSQERRKERERALESIEKLIRSKKTKFDGGPTGLQSYRARAIESHLRMVVRDHVPSILAARRAAQSQGFAEEWGGRCVCGWVGGMIT